MQHTLIPYEERKRLHRDYFVRVAIVFLCIMSVAVLVGAAALFPSYLKTWLSYNSAQSAMSAIKKSQSDTSIEAVISELSRDHEILKALAASSNERRLSDIVRTLVGAKGPITYEALRIARADKETVSITITAVAPRRDDLLNFKTRLENLVPGTTIDLPISQLAKNTNIPFTFRFSQKMP